MSKLYKLKNYKLILVIYVLILNTGGLSGWERKPRGSEKTDHRYGERYCHHGDFISDRLQFYPPFFLDHISAGSRSLSTGTCRG